MAPYTSIKDKLQNYDGYLEQLNTFITEDNKLVTYKWLSNELEVYDDVSKLLLQKYSILHQFEQLTVIHCVTTDELVDGVKWRNIQLVNGGHMTGIKDVTSQFVYSLSKSPVEDSNDLYIVDYETRQLPTHEYSKFLNVQCEEAVKSEPEIKKVDEVKVKTEPVIKTITSTVASTPKTDHKTSSSQSESPIDSKAKSSASPQVKKEKNIMSMLKSAPPKKKVVKKGTAKKVVSAPVKRQSVKLFSSDSEEDEPMEPTPKVNKKRRVISSSEEEEEKLAFPPRDEEPEEAPEAPPSPSASPSGANESFTSSGGERVIKKLVSKTTMDANGYMVTEKVWEMVKEEVTDNDKENEVVEPKKDVKVKPEMKSTFTPDRPVLAQPAKKGKKKLGAIDSKQTSMMSFFKKK